MNHLKEQIERLESQRIQAQNQIEHCKTLLEQNQITKDEHDSITGMLLQSMTSQQYFEELNSQINTLKRSYEQEKKYSQFFHDHHGSILLVGIIIALSVFAMLYAQTSPTGLFSFGQSYEYVVNHTINESGNYYFGLENITSLRATGRIIGEGAVRIYALKDGQKYLVYQHDSSEKNIITGMATGDIEQETLANTSNNISSNTSNITENTTTTSTTANTSSITNISNLINITNTTLNFSNQTIELQNISENNTIPLNNISEDVPEINETVQINISEIAENITNESLPATETEFTNQCIETCILDLPEVVLEVELENAQLLIESFTYTLPESQEIIQVKPIPNISSDNNSISIDLSEYFAGVIAGYDTETIQGLASEVNNGVITYTSTEPKEYSTFVYAYNSEQAITSNTFTLRFLENQLNQSINISLNQSINQTANYSLNQTLNNTNQSLNQTPIDQNLGSEKDEYSYDTETHCNNGECTLTIYSGTKYGYEDGQWKPIEDLRSFKGTTNIQCVVENEQGLEAECLDYNFTYRKIEFKPTQKGNIPIKVLKKELDKATGTEKLAEKSSITKNFDSAPEATEWIRADMDEVIHFGNTSTTITLQDADTENLDDAYVYNQSKTSNYGSLAYMIAHDQAADHYNSIIKFTLKFLPSSANITSAFLGLYAYGNELDNSFEGFNISTYTIDMNNYTISSNEWTESTLTWNTLPTTGDYYTVPDSSYKFFGGSGEPINKYITWDVTKSVNRSFKQGWKNVSIYLISQNRFGSSAANDYVSFRSKEASVSQKPYLNITYVYYSNYTPCTLTSCDFNSDYLLADLVLYEDQNVGDTETWMKWNISAFCDEIDYDSIDSANLQLYITSVSGTLDNDTEIWYNPNQTWDESTDCDIISCEFETIKDEDGNRTTNLQLSSISAGTYTNLSVVKYVREACAQGDKNMTIHVEDYDRQMSTPVSKSDVDNAIGTAHVITPNLMSFGSRESQIEAKRPRLFISFTILPTINLTYPANNQKLAFNESVELNYTVSVPAGATLSNCSLWTNESGSWAFAQANTSAVSLTQNNSFMENFSALPKDYAWNVQCCIQGAGCSFASSNRTVKIRITDYNTCSPVENTAWIINTTLECFNTTAKVASLNITTSDGNLTLTNASVNITGYTVIEDLARLTIINSKNTIWQNGIMTINGTFILDNSTLRMNTSANGSIGIIIQPNSNFTANNSANITNGYNSSAKYFFYAMDGSSTTINKSSVSHAGWANEFNQRGLQINGTAHITNSSFYENYADLTLYTSANTLNYCDLDGNYYALYYQNSSNISLPNIWWGTANEQAIQSRIYDYYDNSNYGIVNYCSYLDASFETGLPKLHTGMESKICYSGCSNDTSSVACCNENDKAFFPNEKYEEKELLILHFSKGSGTAIEDSSGNVANGTLTSGSWVSGKFGKAVNFSGSTDITFADDSDLNITDAITLEAWVYLNGDATSGILYGGNRIISKDNGTQGYFLSVLDDGSYNNITFAVDGLDDYITSSQSLSTHQWYYVVGLKNSTHKAIYINGILDNSIADSSSITKLSGSLKIGESSKQYLASWNNFNGIVDEARITNYPKSSKDILESYKAGYNELLLGCHFDNSGLTQDITNFPETTVLNKDGTLTTTFQISSDALGGDTYINSSATNTNYATNQYIPTSTTTPIVRSLIYFNVSSINENASVTNANISLYTYTEAGNVISIYQVFKPWTESEATWNEWHNSNNYAWNQSGADGTLGECSPYSENEGNGAGCDRSYNISSQLTTTGSLGWSWQTFTGVNLTKLVQMWIDGSADYKRGLLIHSPSGGIFRFVSSEGAVSSYKPKISITYYDPTMPSYYCEDLEKIALGMETTDSILNNGLALNNSNANSINMTNNYNNTIGTIALWIKPQWSGSTTGTFYLFDLGTQAQVTNKQRIYKINDILYFNKTDAGSGKYSAKVNISGWQANQWKHLVFTWNSTTMKIFVDGIEQNSSVFSSATFEQQGTYMYLGSNVQKSQIINATIDELQIFGTVLNSSEVLDEYFRPGNNVDQASCYIGGQCSNGLLSARQGWVDKDSSQSYCEHSSETCTANTWVNSGESISHGDYTDNTVDMCCGDDSNEYSFFKDCTSGECATDTDDVACCAESTDCVWSNTCYASGINQTFGGTGFFCQNSKWIDPKPVLINASDDAVDMLAEIGQDINFSATWLNNGSLNSKKLLIANNTEFANCNYTDDSGCLCNSTTTFGNTSNCYYTLNESDPVYFHWYARVCDSINSCSEITDILNTTTYTFNQSWHYAYKGYTTNSEPTSSFSGTALSASERGNISFSDDELDYQSPGVVCGGDTKWNTYDLRLGLNESLALLATLDINFEGYSTERTASENDTLRIYFINRTNNAKIGNLNSQCSDPACHTEQTIRTVLNFLNLSYNYSEILNSTQYFRLLIYEPDYSATPCQGDTPIIYGKTDKGFVFVADVGNPSLLGQIAVMNGEAMAIPAYAEDYIIVPETALEKISNKYILKFAEEKDEIAYANSLKLLAIDHDHGEVVPDYSLNGKFYLIDKISPPKLCIDEYGSDCKISISKTDNFAWKKESISDYFVAEFSPEINNKKEKYLVVRDSIGYVNYGDEFPYPPKLFYQKPNSKEWIDLKADILRDDNYQTSFKILNPVLRTFAINVSGINISRIKYQAVGEKIIPQVDFVGISTTPQKQLTINEIAPEKAALLSSSGPSINVEGKLTRTGDVLELVNQKDQTYAVISKGDEIVLEYQVPEQKKPERTIIFYSSSYYKRLGQYNSVLPLPFRGMQEYPYKYSEQDLPEYYKEYNTRTAEKTQKEHHSLYIDQVSVVVNKSHGGFEIGSADPICEVTAITENSAYGYATGNTMFYNNKASTMQYYNVTVTATDFGAGMEAVSFPLTTSDGGDYLDLSEKVEVVTHPYNWTSADSTSYYEDIIVFDQGYTNSGTCKLNVTLDTTNPSGMTIAYPDQTIQSKSILVNFTNGTDAKSGLQKLQLYRRSATLLAGGTCSGWTTWTAVGSQTLSQTQYTDTSLEYRKCYQYNLTVWDNVNNKNYATSSNIVKIDPCVSRIADWTITDEVTCEDKKISFGGSSTGINVNSGGKLSLINTTLVFNLSSDGERGIIVNAGGTLILIDKDSNPSTTNDASNITTNNSLRYSYLVVGSYSGSTAYLYANNSFISNMGWDDSFNSRGIEVRNAANSELINNTFKNNYVGISLGGNNNFVANNNIFNSRYAGIKLISYGSTYHIKNNVIANNTFENSTNFGIIITNIGINNHISNNTFWNNTINRTKTGISARGLQNSTFTFERVDNANTSIELINAKNNTFISSIIQNTNYFDVKINSTGSTVNNTFLNVSFNKTNISFISCTTNTCQLWVKWFLDVFVNDTSVDNNKADFIVNISDSDNNIYSNITDSQGLITTQNITEYWQNSTTKYYYTNYTINVSKSLYLNQSRSVNITSSRKENFSLYLLLNITDVDISPAVQGFGRIIELNITATGADTAKAEITLPNGTSTNYSMQNLGSDIWNYNFTGWKTGQYNLSFFVNDSANHNYSVSGYSFNISSNISMEIATFNEEYQPDEYVNITNSTSENKSFINNSGNANSTVWLVMEILWYNQTSTQWQSDDVVVNESIEINSGVKEIDSYFNQKWNTSENATYGYGTYIINLSLRDNQSNVLENDDGTLLNASHVFLYGNQPPITPNVYINSTDGTNSTSQNLNCFAAITDVNGDLLNITVNWSKNGVYNKTDNYNNNYPSGIQFNATLGYGNTSPTQNWSCSIMLFDGESFSGWGNSSNITVLNYAPTLPTLLFPEPNNNTLHNRSLMFNWTGSTDVDDYDTITYEINVTAGGEPCYTSTSFYQTNVSDSNFSHPTIELCTRDEFYSSGLAYYNWSVRACDDSNASNNCSSWAALRNFSLEPWVIITFLNNSLNFGNLSLLEIDDTTDDDPEPFQIRNDGNVRTSLVNMSTEGTLWVRKSMGTEYFQMKASDRTEPGSIIDTENSSIEWFNVTNGINQTVISQLNYSDSSDEAEIDVRVKVPGDEPGGEKFIEMTFYWEQDMGDDPWY